METQITQAFVDLVLAISALVGSYLVMVIRKRISLSSIQTAQNVARIVVGFAEQVGKTQGWSPQDKLQNALSAARSLGEKHGVKLTNSQWRNLIEAEVKNIKTWGFELTQPDPVVVPPAVVDPVQPDPAPVDPAPAPDPVPVVPPAPSAASVTAAQLRAMADQLDASSASTPAP